MVAILFGREGVASQNEADAEAALRAIECLVEKDAPVVAPIVMPLIELWLDRQEAEALSPSDIRIFETPEGRTLHVRSSSYTL